MDETRMVRFSGHLDPHAQEYRPRTSSPPTQIAHLGPFQMFYPYPSSSLYPITSTSISTTATGLQMMPFYDGTVGYHQLLPASEPYFRPTRAYPPSPTATRALLLSWVPTNVSETMVRRDLEVFGEVRTVQMERLQDGIVTVHFYDLRRAEAALAEIQEQHMQQQSRLRQHYIALQEHHINFPLGLENFPPPLPLPAPGLIAGCAVWAQFTVPEVFAGPDGHNQGTLVVFNLDLEVSSSQLKEIFGPFGPLKELRETPLKRHQRFVEFFDIRDAAKALYEMDGKEIHGKHVIIEFSRPGGHSRRRSSHYMKTGKHPSPKSPSLLPPRLMGCSSSDAFPCHPSQTVCVPKKSSCGGDAGSNQKSNHARMTEAAAAQGSLSLTIVGNGSEGERDVSGTSRNARSNNILSAPTKQSRSRNLKARHERPDAHFLINEDAIVESDIRDTRTTVMIKNIPNKYSRKLLLNMLDNHCVHCNEQIAEGDGQPLSSYDFVYLPIDFLNKCNVGYGFVNLTSPQATLRLYKAFHMRPWEVFNSRKICEVTYARLQGLEALKEHFKNSQFACEIEEYLPAVFSPPRDGKQLSEPMTIASQPKVAVTSRGQNGRVRAGEDDDGIQGGRVVDGGGGRGECCDEYGDDDER